MSIKTKPKNKQRSDKGGNLAASKHPSLLLPVLILHSVSECRKKLNREQYDVDTGGEARLAKQKSLYTTVCTSSDNQ